MALYHTFRAFIIYIMFTAYVPVCINLVDDPDLVLHILSLKEAMNVWNKLNHFFIAVPEWYYHCQLMGIAIFLFASFVEQSR